MMYIETKIINGHLYYRSKGGVSACAEIQRDWKYKTPWVRLEDTSRYKQYDDYANFYNNWKFICPKCNHDSFKYVENLDSGSNICLKCHAEYQLSGWSWEHSIALKQMEVEKGIKNNSIVFNERK